MDRDAPSYRPFVLPGKRVLRREVLKAAGVGVGASVVGTGRVGAQPSRGTDSDPYDALVDVSSDQVSHATVDPGDLPAPEIPDDPEILGEGEGEEVPRGAPNGGGGNRSTPEPKTGTTGSGLSVETDYDGFNTRDVVRGIDLDDDGEVEASEIFFSVPSDAQLATGSDWHVTAINSELGFIEKGAPEDGADRVGGSNDDSDYITHYRLEDFFYDVLSLDPDDEDNDGDGDPDALQFENVQVFDPRARYDPDSGRYLVGCVEFNLPDTKPDDDGTLDENGDGDATDENESVEISDPSDFHGAYLLAVSSSSNPNDPWEIYRIEPETNGGLVDYPTLGYDGEAVYLSQNFFDYTDDGAFVGFRGATLTVLDKGDLADGVSDPAGVEAVGLRNPDGSLAFTLQPAAMPGSTGPFHLANSRFGNGQTLTVWDVSGDKTSTEEIEISNDSVRVAPYANAPAAQQDDTNKKIDTLDTRLMNLAYDAGRETLWTAHTTAEGYVRWYELDPTGPGVVQSAGYQRNNWSTFLPTVESNGESTMMAYNVSAEQQFAGIEVAGREADYTAGELQDHAVVQPGEVAYNYDDTKGDFGPGPEENVLRWGDYNGIGVDPDDGSYWLISQYAADPQPGQDGPAESELYGTRIANVTIDGADTSGNGGGDPSN